MLLQFLTNGLKILYADQEGKVDIFSVSNNPQRLIQIDKYMKSVGIVVNLDYYNELQWIHRQAVNTYTPFDKKIITNNTKLNEMEYCFIRQIPNQTEAHYFLISFDVLK